MRLSWLSILSLAVLVGLASAAPVAEPALEQREAYEQRSAPEAVTYFAMNHSLCDTERNHISHVATPMGVTSKFCKRWRWRCQRISFTGHKSLDPCGDNIRAL
ncbi:hypothetical protein IEO21_00239 [Rhodonia placenta]|uniref:Candidate secreted effector protein n=1 Tax=Rhodonia placenta TaxID=104341 RepID=A0A8H7PBK4_9APHY|nr:hypothetical protein IEO21_00239 [Postia placenta]